LQAIGERHVLPRKVGDVGYATVGKAICHLVVDDAEEA
jgi:hypothetical protein